MTAGPGVNVAIVDYGMGNLFSVQQACSKVGLAATIAALPEQILAADGVILPGVGAFGDAMSNLNRLGLGEALKESVAAQKPLVGICLGMQLLMTESHEFGRHRGLDIIKGRVTHLEGSSRQGERVKVPHVGWSGIYPPRSNGTVSPNGILREAGVDRSAWDGTPLESLREDELMYFVHSFQCQPEDLDIVLSYTEYGPNRFCSALSQGNVFGCQFHPERSGPKGLHIYQNIGRMMENATQPMKIDHV